MSAYIPGPYKVDGDGDISLAYGEGWTLAFTIDTDDCQPIDMNGPDFTAEQLQGTRLLFAMSPQLVDALRAVVDEAEAFCDGPAMAEARRILKGLDE